jgi:hypothetical protein
MNGAVSCWDHLRVPVVDEWLCSTGKIIFREEDRSTFEKPLRVSPFSPSIPHVMAWDWTRVFAMSHVLFLNHGSDCCDLCIWKWQEVVVACSLTYSPHHLLWRTETLCSGEVNEPAAPTTFDSRTSEYGVLLSTPFWGRFSYSNRNCVIVLRSKFFPVPRKYSNGKC